MWSALRDWWLWAAASERDPLVRAYREASQRRQWHVLAALAVLVTLTTPLLFRLELAFVAPVAESSASAFLLIRLASGGVSVLFLVAYVLGRGRPRTTTGERILAHVAIIAPVALAVAVFAANPTAPAPVTMYVISLMITILVAYASPQFVTLLMLTSAATMIGTSLVLHEVAVQYTTTIYTVMRAVVFGVILYVAYDRSRFLAFKAQADLQDLNALKDTVFHALAHDLKGPMQRAERATDALDRAITTGRVPPDFEAHKRDVAIATQQAAHVIENLTAVIDTAGGEAVAGEDVFAIETLLERVVEMATPSAEEKDVRLTLAVEDADVLAQGRLGLAVGLLRNLVDNAVKFSRDGSEVRIETRTQPDAIHVTVSDSGIGMDAGTLEKIRQGRRVASAYGTHGELGTGIGLLVARTFAGNLGTGVTLESVPEHGTCASFTLPRYRAQDVWADEA